MSNKLLNVLAAGSLRSVWQPLMNTFSSQTGINVHTQFGPAGLLRQRIEQGETVDLFASANQAHPQSLLAQRIAQRIETFTHNRLCLTVRSDLVKNCRSWLDLLRDSSLRLGTSTPFSDPSGDYTWQLFENIEKHHAGVGKQLSKSALPLVGGPQSAAVPQGELAAAWLILSGQCELFIGYASYAEPLAQCEDLRVIEIPEGYNIRADYAFAQCSQRSTPLSNFLLSETAQEYFKQKGFGKRG